MAGVEIHAARPKTAPSVLSQILGARNPLNAARTTVAPWLRGTEERVPSVIPGLLAGAIEQAPIFAPTVGEAVGKTGEAVVGPELLAAMKMMERDPTQRTDLMQGMMNSPIAYPMAAMTLYHGSPHKFDRFDLSKVGTGEGAQAYGHGIYLAEKPGVAKSYAEKLSDEAYKIDGVPMAGNSDPVIVATQIQALGGPDKAKSYFLDEAAKAADLATRSGSQKMAGAASNFQKWADMVDEVAAKKFEVQNAGNLYTVDIPDELIEGRLLDWDAPLSEQPEVMKAVRKALDDYHEIFSDDPQVRNAYKDAVLALRSGNMTGEGAYKALSRVAGGPQAASDILGREYGIPGLRYFDGGSRGAGDGTRNLVIWAQDILDKAGVTRK